MNKQHTPRVTITNEALDALKLGEPVTSSAAAELLRQQHEIERLNAALKWEQDRSEHIGTHGQGCHTWGPRHYECLLREYKVLLDALETRIVKGGEVFAAKIRARGNT